MHAVALGKWSLVDTYFMCIFFVSFRYHVELDGATALVLATGLVGAL